MVEAGYQDFADRWNPILDVFEEVGVPLRPRAAPDARSPTTTGRRWRPSRPSATARLVRPQLGSVAHGLAGLDAVGFLWDFKDRIFHVHCKDTKPRLDGRSGRLSSHLPGPTAARGWDFISTGHGDVPWEASFRMLNQIGYTGPISVEWEDAGMDRLIGAPEALEYVRRLAFEAPTAAFDAAFSTKAE